MVLIGGVIITGGYDTSEKLKLGETETLEMFTLPHLPLLRADFPLVSIGSVIYLCGGQENYGTADGSREKSRITGSCYILDTASEEPSWAYFTRLPEITHHLAAVIQSKIWLLAEYSLYSLNPNTRKYKTYDLPFQVTSAACAANNATHIFIFGVGYEYKDIWINRDASEPTAWKKIETSIVSNRESSCLWFGDTIYVAGGTNSTNALATVMQFNVDNYSMTLIGSLNEERAKSRMMILDNSPAIVGGYYKICEGNWPSINTIEIYNENVNLWETSFLRLLQPRARFGLAQILK